SIRNNGCRQIDAPLRRVETPGGFTFEMDYVRLEEVASDARNRLLILCNPHNPTGRVWRREELERVRDICRRHDVMVVSDEIHCELTHGSISYVPYATVDDRAIVCVSPSKAFNTAGLQIAAIVCPDERVRARVDRAINDNEVCDVNPFGVEGLIAAYTRGEEWLDALRAYLDANYARLREVVTERLPRWRVCDSESTYLAWIDVSGSGLDGDEVAKALLAQAKVRVSPGSDYGAPEYIRINYACPRRRLDEALERICRWCGRE
ncbi:MAG: aminotransferase class I/II-fold pyridoxal phosphate-dependent enzyme, partial [Duncaniella sp.]|nr:aminotransferase class I/II-fold pyridoxal phosphate-dependent enzyme [Duncaniella sp.]